MMKKVFTIQSIYSLSFSLLFILLSFSGLLAQEICDNRIDDDGDGLIDCLDPDCAGNETCWPCITEFYQVHSNNSLVALNPQLGTYTELAHIEGADQINGAQFNIVDGHVYAPIIIDGEHKLGMLQANGSVIDLGLSLPGASIFYCGAIDANGKMFVGNSNQIATIDLNQAELQFNPLLNSGLGVADFSLDITRGLFYGVTSSAKLKVLDPYTLDISTYDLAGSINNESGAFGAAWSCVDGSFFCYNNNSGKIYSINVNNLTTTQVLNATGNLSINDGFNCVLSLPPFESVCGDGIDNDGDGLIDCEDGDCYNANECTIEICDNGIDDDGDGWIDCSDSECFSLSVCLEICDNNIDDNDNGLVDGDDPQCGISGGVSGGLESNNRLSDKIAQRNFNRKVLDPQEFIELDKGLIPFNTFESKSKFDLAGFIPTEIEDLYVAESTPLDLIEITNATDVSGADYYRDDLRIATVLVIKSEKGVYEHTKYICDRLDGARLLDISFLNYNGNNLISYELLNKYGQIEYAVNFAASYLEEEGFAIESHWNLHKYDKEKDFYNFQLWAESYTSLLKILDGLMNKIASTDKITSIKSSDFPQNFIIQGDYINGQLRLHLKNKTKAPSFKFSSNLRRVENGELEFFEENIPLSGNFEEIIYVDTEHLYDLGASLDFSTGVTDEIFLADGSWGVDESNPNAQVRSFVVEDQQANFQGAAYHVERTVRVEAEVKDYLNIYRSLDAKLNPKDLNYFDELVFKAQGTGQMELTVVKAGIENWDDQFRTTIELPDDEEIISLNKDQFYSSSFESINFKDVTMLVFTLLGDNDQLKEKTIVLSEVRFQNSLNTSSEENLSSGFNIYPNPTSDFINIEGDNLSACDFVKIIDQTGKVMKLIVYSKKTEPNLRIEISQMPPGIYNVITSSSGLESERGRFVKIN